MEKLGVTGTKDWPTLDVNPATYAFTVPVHSDKAAFLSATSRSSLGWGGWGILSSPQISSETFRIEFHSISPSLRPSAC